MKQICKTTLSLLLTALFLASCTKENMAGAVQNIQSINSSNLTGDSLYIGAPYQNGIVFYITDNGKHGMVMSTAFLPAEVYKWEIYHGWKNVDSTGATDTTIGGGLKNTTKIVKLLGKKASAAYACATYNEGGYQWWLPSKGELNEIWKHKVELKITEAFGYWSSSEWVSGYKYAWFQDFYAGQQYPTGKGSSYRVRAVHSF